jgi:hypothetical protein
MRHPGFESGWNDLDVEAKNRLWKERCDEISKHSENRTGIFNERLRPTALALRDEMRSRLGMVTPVERTERGAIALDYGMLAGVSPVGEIADMLERLARQLQD